MMAGNGTLVLSVGAMALTTIVAIYYLWVRKLGKPDQPTS